MLHKSSKFCQVPFYQSLFVYQKADFQLPEIDPFIKKRK